MSGRKSLVLIGGSYGIGSSLAEALSAKGHDVFILSRTKPELDNITHIEFDVTKNAVDTVHLPESIEGLVYLPGTIQLKPFHRFTDEDFLNDFSLNTLYAAKIIRGLLPRLKVAEQSSVVLFSTVAVQQGMPFHASVAMAKGALEGFTRSLAAELAPKIRVNAVAPSVTNTPLASKLLSNDEKKKASGERHPLKRVGESQDIANAAAYLLGEESSWITGQIIHVDGGISTLRV